MEQLLIKLARQLDNLDEASLMSLWDKYAATVNRFEPTRRWEEAALVFSLIQAKRWKNQLFNQQWAAQARPGQAGQAGQGGQEGQQGAPAQSGFSLEKRRSEAEAGNVEAAQKRGKVLSFRPLKGD